MHTTQEQTLLKLKFENDFSNAYEDCDNESLLNINEVEFEMIAPVDFSDKRKIEIYQGFTEIDKRLDLINEKVANLNSDINRLTNQTDWIDNTIAVASGIITGIIDSIYVGEEDFSIDSINKLGDKKAENFVIKIAQKKGYKGNDLPGAIKYLEDKFPIAADKATNDFGGGKQHHLRDFSHHPTPLGLIFSLLTQFTHKVYGTDVAGVFKIVELKNDDLILIGKNLPEKITFGVVNWFFHMVSDMAGSYSSVLEGKVGTGLPGPIGSLLKEMSALPFFKNMNEQNYKKFSIWVSKLFNGTLLGKRDEKGKLITSQKFDLRTEIGIASKIGKQAVPVIINECIVRGFYFIRRFYIELKDNDVRKINEFNKVNWNKTLPIKNRTIVRMMTIATGTFTAIDLADAGIRAVIKSGGFNAATLGNFILRVNFVGVGRFAIAVGTDVGMGIKKANKENERIKLIGEQLQLLNAKIYYKQADMWIEAEKTEKALREVYIIMDKTAIEFVESWNEFIDKSKSITDSAGNIKQNNPELAVELLDILEYEEIKK